jgi:hypothetical protein
VFLKTETAQVDNGGSLSLLTSIAADAVCIANREGAYEPPFDMVGLGMMDIIPAFSDFCGGAGGAAAPALVLASSCKQPNP